MRNLIICLVKPVNKYSIFSLVAALNLCGLPALAATNAIPSCYDAKLTALGLPLTKELFVLVDQTTLLDEELKQSVAEQVRPFLSKGNGFSVVVFSAFTQGKYTQLLTSGQLDHAMPDALRSDVSKPVLGKFDQCITRQTGLAGQAVGGALRSAFEGSSGEIAKSDVLASLKDISGKVRQSKATEKVVLLVSDMLENSSVSSFYANQSVRKIEPSKEMKLATDNNLIADFGGARVFVLGAGLLSEDAKKKKASYRDPKTMSALADFWKSYFEKSNAQLIEFGQPALLNQIK
jgi:hypothetical protein